MKTLVVVLSFEKKNKLGEQSNVIWYPVKKAITSLRSGLGL